MNWTILIITIVIFLLIIAWWQKRRDQNGYLTFPEHMINNIISSCNKILKCRGKCEEHEHKVYTLLQSLPALTPKTPAQKCLYSKMPVENQGQRVIETLRPRLRSCHSFSILLHSC